VLTRHTDRLHRSPDRSGGVHRRSEPQQESRRSHPVATGWDPWLAELTSPLKTRLSCHSACMMPLSSIFLYQTGSPAAAMAAGYSFPLREFIRRNGQGFVISGCPSCVAEWRCGLVGQELVAGTSRRWSGYARRGRWRRAGGSLGRWCSAEIVWSGRAASGRVVLTQVVRWDRYPVLVWLVVHG
jgi:hypothetical protein